MNNVKMSVGTVIAGMCIISYVVMHEIVYYFDILITNPEFLNWPELIGLLLLGSGMISGIHFITLAGSAFTVYPALISIFNLYQLAYSNVCRGERLFFQAAECLFYISGFVFAGIIAFLLIKNKLQLAESLAWFPGQLVFISVLIWFFLMRIENQGILTNSGFLSHELWRFVLAIGLVIWGFSLRRLIRTAGNVENAQHAAGYTFSENTEQEKAAASGASSDSSGSSDPVFGSTASDPVQFSDVRMGRHKFLIYFLMWLWVIMDISACGNDLQLMNELDPFISSLKFTQILPIHAFTCLLLAVYTIKVRFDLARFRKKAPNNLQRLFCITIAVNIFGASFFLINGFSVDNSFIARIISGILTIFFYRRYYNIRDHYFTR